MKFCLCLVATLIGSNTFAQPPHMRRVDVKQQQQQAEQQAQRMKEQIQSIAENSTDFADPQLMTLHKEFVAKAEKLAIEYERKKQFDQAREVYSSLVRLIPNYTPAEDGLARILNNQTAQDKRLATVLANQAWQDSGASLIDGVPVRIETKGTWKVVVETDSRGIELTEEQKPRDNRIKLGTLVGVIANTPAELASERPFAIESGNVFIAQKTGQLYLRMFDIDPADNDGKLLVLIQSTFGK